MTTLIVRTLRNTKPKEPFRRTLPKEFPSMKRTLRNVSPKRQEEKIAQGRQEWWLYFHSTPSEIVTAGYYARLIEKEFAY